jgi:hypothetical protein
VRAPLEPPHDELGVRAEMAVNAPDAVPAPAKEELEDGDVVADRSAAEDALAVERFAEPAESTPRLWAGKAVNREPATALERTHRRLRPRALDAVDRSAVETVRAKRGLEPGDLRVRRRGGVGDRERCAEGGGECQDAMHPPAFGGPSPNSSSSP